MGCCSSREEEVTIELNTTQNAAVVCRGGKVGTNVKMNQNDKGDWQVKGKGTMLGSCCLDCDTAYWEVKVVQGAANVDIGLKKFNKRRPVSLEGTIKTNNEGKGDEPCWSLQRDFLPKDITDLKDGDVIGVHWDQTDFPMVCFALNGEFLPNASITRIRPAQDIHPAVSVTGNGIVEIRFDSENFQYKPIASKFSAIVCATNLI